MTAATFKLIDFDGFSLTGSYQGTFLTDFDIAAQFPLDAVMKASPGRFPTFVRGDPQDRIVPVHITMGRGTGIAVTQAQIDELKKAFSPSKGVSFLRVQDSNGVQRRMRAKSLGLVPWEGHDDQGYVASLQAPMPVWERDSVEGTLLTVSGTAAGQNLIPLTNVGNERTFPAFILEPQTYKSDPAFGWGGLIPVIIAWRSPLEGIDSLGLGYPIDITNGALDSTAMVDGQDDLRVFVDGVEVDRYLERPNTTGTAVWCSISFQPMRTAESAVAMTAGSPANGGSLLVSNAEGTTAFPEQGALLIGTECITYKGKTFDTFLDVRRSRRGTIPASHSAGDTIYWVEHRIAIIYGYSGAWVPKADPDRKPMIDLATSTNAHHKYGTTDGFIDPDTLRPGQWIRELRGVGKVGEFNAQSQASGEAVFGVTEPTAEAPNFDTLSLYTPCLVNTSDGIDYDPLIDHAMVMRLFAVDESGFETLSLIRSVLYERWPDQESDPSLTHYAVGAASYQGSHAFVPTNVLTRVAIQMAGSGLVGLDASSTLDLNSVASTTVKLGPDIAGGLFLELAQTFTVDQVADLSEVTFWCRLQTVSGTAILHADIYEPGIEPDTLLLATSVTVPDTEFTPFLTQPVTIRIGGELGLAALIGGMRLTGRVAVIFSVTGGIGSEYRMQLRGVPYLTGGSFWENDGTWVELKDSDMAVTLTSYTSDPQEDLRYGSGRESRIKNIDVHFDADHTPQIVTPNVRPGYYLDATITNPETGQILTLQAPLYGILLPSITVGSRLKIDTDAHAVTIVYQSGDHEEDALWAMEPGGTDAAGAEVSDIFEWLRLDPGANVLEYDENSAGDILMEIEARFRSRWT